MDRSKQVLHVDEETLWPRLDRRIAVIVTDEDRMILTRDRMLTIYPADVTKFDDRRPRTIPVLDWDDLSVGKRWTYRTLVNGKVIERTTDEVVEEVRTIDGDLSESGPRDAVDFGSPTRRTEVREIWIGESIEPSVTIWITTQGYGDWDGTWVLSGSEIDYRFVPRDPSAEIRTWPCLMTARWARVEEMLWLDRRVCRSVWTPVAYDGCGLVKSIIIEEADT